RQSRERGLARVYRVLTQFEQAGLRKRSNFASGEAVFVLDHGDHHDHLVCLRCGRVEEFFDEDIERRQREIATDRGFTLQDHSLALYGYCNKPDRSEEHTSELQSRENLVCRLLLDKKKKQPRT